MKKKEIMIRLYKKKDSVIAPHVLLGCLLKRGNKERAIMQFIKLLLEIRRVSNFLNLTIDKETPDKLLERIIAIIAPGFHLRKLSRGGRIYNIPVPVTKKHSFFVACHWILTSAKLHPQKKLPIYLKILSELKEFTLNKGGAYSSFQSYIAIALDQRPFSRLVRRKKIKHFLRKKKSRFLRPINMKWKVMKKLRKLRKLKNKNF
jgi:hypothetical protein